MNFPKIQINKASVSYVHHFLKEDIYCKIDFSKYLYNTIMTTIDDTFKLFCVPNVNYISSMKGR